MIRNRLAKLEKLVAEAMANCPGCARIAGRILVPSLVTGETPAPVAAEDEFARCDVCGKVQRRPVVRFVVPGLPEPFMAMD